MTTDLPAPAGPDRPRPDKLAFPWWQPPRATVSTRTLRLIISYDGTDFAGWQLQPGQRTVQGLLDAAIADLLGHEVTTTASGRTDSGVHALGQVVQFSTVAHYPPETFVAALNARLPEDLRVRDADEVSQAFHATLDARSKTYRYLIDNGRVASPLTRRFSHHVPKPLDDCAMRRAARALLGRHDFRSFETQWPNRTSSVRTILRADVARRGRYVAIDVEADGFLYNMVRAIAGTLYLVGNGRWPEERVAEVVAAEDRRQAGPTAPARGLCLLRVNYGTGRDAGGFIEEDDAMGMGFPVP